VALGAGTVLGVGPLATVVPPDEVTDPKEMLARSLQATLDASAVHLDGTIDGTIPGRFLDRPETVVRLDGTRLDADVRPHDGKTRARVTSPGLELSLDTVTVWDSGWYRTAADGPWSRASLGGASAEAGVDINPLTLVDRLRAYLATPGAEPTVRDVPCAGESGRCHEIRLEAGADPVAILALMLPRERAEGLPPIDVVVTVQTDALTLRPVRLIAEGSSEDGSVRIRVRLDAGRWDEDLVIEQPSESPG
jgi:hypothetical protein